VPQQRDTLHRSTVRTGIVDALETERTPIPGEVVSRQESSSISAIVIVLLIVLIAGAAIGFVLMRKPAPQQVAAQTQTQTQAPQPIAAPVKPQANVEVVSPAPVLTQPATTTTQAIVTAPAPVKKRPAPKPVIEKPREPEPQREPRPAPVPVRTYVEGGDSDANDQLLANAKNQLRGVTRLTVHANSDMLKELTDRLKREVPGVTIAEGADTVVDFNGVLERLGRGKKRRSAQASVSRNGRVIFRYELPPEEYRVGDTPTEAFARVLADALH
jgi:hypothetical protein